MNRISLFSAPLPENLLSLLVHAVGCIRLCLCAVLALRQLFDLQLAPPFLFNSTLTLYPYRLVHRAARKTPQRT